MVEWNTGILEWNSYMHRNDSDDILLRSLPPSVVHPVAVVVCIRYNLRCEWAVNECVRTM